MIEYRTQMTDLVDLSRQLHMAGKDGWELVSAVPQGDRVILIFKKQG